MFEQVTIPKKLKRRLGRAISIVMSIAMLVTALPADLLGGIMSVKAADDANVMVLDITELAADSSNPMGLANDTASFTGPKKLGNFTIMATGDAAVDVDKNGKTWDNPAHTFTHRLKLGGTGSATARNISFTTDGAATVVAYAMSGSSGEARPLKLYTSEGKEVGTYDAENPNAPGDKLYRIELPKIEAAGSYYLASASKGINVYRVEVTVEASSSGGTGDGDGEGSGDGLDKLRADDLAYLIEGEKENYDFVSVEAKLGQSVFSVVTDTNAVTVEKTVPDTPEKKGNGGPWEMPDGSDKFEYRLKLGGSGSTTKRAIKFTPKKDGRFIVYAISGSSSADRILVLQAGDAKQELPAPGAGIKASEAEVKAGVTYYLYSKSSGINLFYLELDYTPKPPEVIPRGPWEDVQAPEIKNVALKEDDASTINVVVDGFVEYDGADSIEVDMINAKGDVVKTLSTAVKSKKDATGEYNNEHTLEFKPTATGEYTFIARLVREGEENKTSEESEAFPFKLPLSTPVIVSVTNKGKDASDKGRLEIAWQKVTEANNYEVTVTPKAADGAVASGTAQTVTTIALKAVVEGLEIGSEVEISVVALRSRDNSKSAAGTQTAKVNGETERTWAFTAYGASTNLTTNGYTKHDDGSVTVYSENGSGKIVTATTDGLAYYYTAMDPDTENFTLTADVHVDSWTYSNGQDGFGLMVSDAVGESGNTSDFWTNSYQLLSTKIEYRWDPTLNDGKGGVTTADVVDPVRRYSMRQGLGWVAKTGVTALDVANINTGSATAPASFSSTNGTLETSAGEAYLETAGLTGHNMVGNITNPSDKIPTYGTTLLPNMKPVTDFKLQIQRNNTGYILRYLSNTEKDAEGKPVVLNERTFYDYDRNTLTQIDKNNIYVGFIAARNARITVSNIELTTIDPDKDEAAAEREYTTVISNYTISSPEYSNSSRYDLIFSGNQDGNLTILGDNDKTVAMNAPISAGKKYLFGTRLQKGANNFKFVFVPDPDYTPGEYQKMDNHDTWIQDFTVTYQELTGEEIYVAPTGKSDNDGTKESPLDIYTAVNFAHAGQTIYLAGGKYDLEDILLVGKGHDGTEKAPITMMAAADAVGANRPVLDFTSQKESKSAFTIAGDYWHLKGFDVTNSLASQKGIQLSGDYNLLEDLKTYLNGNTGIQIARYGSDGRADWPSYNTVLNCSSYMNADPGYEDADGFAAKLTIGEGNRFVGCIAAYNADDGWDLFAKREHGSIGSVTIENCLAFKNGYVLGTREIIDGKQIDTLDLNSKNELEAGNGNGFKMGGESLPGHHVLKNSVAFGNRAKGIDSNSCPDIQVYNSVSFNNVGYNVAFYTSNKAISTDYFAQGVLSYRTKGAAMNDSAIKHDQIDLQTQNESKVYGATNFYFNGTDYVNNAGVKVADDWFKSMDMQTAIWGNASGAGQISRKADRSIDMHGFLELTDKVPAGVGATLESTSYEDIIASTKPIEVNVIAATVTTLNDVKGLPEGYEWAYPETLTDVFAGTKSAFIAKDKTTGVERTAVVNFIDITGVELTADKASLTGEETLKLTAKPITAPVVTDTEFASAQGAVTPSYEIKESTRLNLSVTAVDGAANAKNVTRTTGSGEGLAKFTAVMSVTIKNKTIKHQAVYSFTTRKTPFAFTYDINTAGVTKNANGSITVASNVTSFALENLKVTGVEGGEDVKVATNDPKVVKVNGNTVTVAGEGTATLTLTASADKTKTVVQIVPVTVRGTELKANVSTITVDKAKTSGAQITAVACYGEKIVAGSVSVKSVLKGKTPAADLVGKLTVTPVVGNIYSISADDTIANGTYNLVLQGKLEGSAADAALTEFEPLAVKVIETKPTVSFKQTKKVNLFYTYNSNSGKGTLKPNCKLAGVTLTQAQNDASAFKLAADGKTGNYTVSLKKEAEGERSPNKRMTVNVSFTGYKAKYDKVMTINIATENRAPKLVLEVDNKVLYTQLGINSTEIRVLDKTTETYISGAEVVLASSTTAYQRANANFTLDEENGTYILGTDRSGSAKISVKDKDWTKEIVISQAITVNRNKPTATFAVAKLNGTPEYATLEQADAVITVKNAKDYKIKDLQLTKTNALSEAVLEYLDYKVVVDAEGQNVLQVSLNKPMPIKGNGKCQYSGTYTFNATFKINKVEQSARVKVSIAPAATVTTAQKGSIELVNRSGSSITVKPTLKNLNGTIVDMYLKDDASNLFDVTWDSAKESAVVKAKALTDMKKGGKYKVTPVFQVQLENGVVEVEARTINIVPKSTSVKTTTILPMETRLSAPGVTAVASVKAKSPANAEILGMTQMTYLDKFLVEYDEQSDTLFVQLADTAGLKAGTTYKVQMALEVQDEGVNVKKQTIMVPVKVLN